MGWDFEIPHTSNNTLSDIEVGALYKIKHWIPKFKTQSANQHSKMGENIIVPLRRLTYNMNTGDTELTVLMNNEITVLPGWMIGQNGGLLEKLSV
jgi:hypothetical protein